jgi:hypothetical protein
MGWREQLAAAVETAREQHAAWADIEAELAYIEEISE